MVAPAAPGAGLVAGAVVARTPQGRGSGRGFRGGAGTRGGRGPQPTMDKPKREAILDLTKYVNERIRVKFTGGREGAF